MARQSLIPLLLLAGCLVPEPYGGAFELPVAAAILQPELGGPFEEPVGFVANGHGGQIVQLALKQGRFLTDDATVSFLRTNQLATGDDRRLGAVAVYAPAASEEVTIYATDQAFGQLLRVPYIVGRDERGAPEEVRATVTDPSEAALPDGLSISDLSVKTGYTTTETWTFRFEGGAYRARGSRSGIQADPIELGEPWSARDRRLNLTLSGTAREGDSFELQTDSGLTEIEVGGTPIALAMMPDQSVMAVVVEDRAEDRARLWWVDPATGTVGAEVVLPEGAHPHRVDVAEDGQLLVADRARNAAYVVAPGAAVATEVVLPWPTLDVASLEQEDGTSLLYVVPLDGLSYWVVDRETGALHDLNVLTPGVQGLPFEVPIAGIEAMEHSYLSSEYTEDGLRRRVRSVAIATVTGNIVFAHEDTGCLVQDNLGPRTNPRSSVTLGVTDNTRSFESEAVSGPRLERNSGNDGAVQVNACAGIAAQEEWSLTYDQNLGAWRVEGDFSGVQQALAYEDERYLSDNAEISFMLRSGATPSRDGWRIEFTVNDGVGEATGNFDNDANGARENSVRVPGDPVYFFYRVGVAGAVGDVDPDLAWSEVDIRPFTLVPGGATNLVGRVNPMVPVNAPDQSSPEIEIRWE